MLFFVFVVTSISLLSSEVCAQTTLYEDNFNDGNANGWIVIGSSGWIVQGGQYGIHLDPGLSNSVPDDTHWNYGWKNISYEVDLRGVAGVDKNILVKFKDTSNFLEIHHNASGIYLEKFSSLGGSFRYFSPYPLINGATYHFKIDIDNDHIKVFVDGNIIFDVTEDPPFFDNWKIGLRVGTGAVSPTEVWYDNVVVNWIGEEPPPPPSTIGPFDLPIEYTGRPTGNPNLFKSIFWSRLTAAFDHVLQGGTYRPFTGNSYKHYDCPNGVLGITCYDGHNGTDFSRVGGENVYSVADGTVEFASEHTLTDCTPNKGGFGCVVIVQYPDNVYGLYAHLDRIDVNEGGAVSENTMIGSMGNTGCPSCGVHLHFGVMTQTPLASSISQRMSRADWKELLYQIRPSAAPRYKPFCTYKAPNGISYAFQDPSAWAGGGLDPWSLSKADGGCGISSPYLWKYQIGVSP